MRPSRSVASGWCLFPLCLVMGIVSPVTSDQRELLRASGASDVRKLECPIVAEGSSRAHDFAALFGLPPETRWGFLPAFLHGAPPQAIALNCVEALARGSRLTLLDAVPRLRVHTRVPDEYARYGWNTFSAYNPSIQRTRGDDPNHDETGAVRRASGATYVVAWRHTNHNNCHNFFQPIVPQGMF
mmetsp:Transcript_49157/g.158240  ORF Transcript_49157/g.158240 Transcript_49157/m.158240 type:complete len:185 (-) Transcript_49157:521-1075(-)